MPASSFNLDGTNLKLVVAFLGAVVSLKFVQGSWIERVLMALGGFAMSFFTSPFVIDWFNLKSTSTQESVEGAVGFLIGLFGMTLVNKVYEGIQALNSSELVTRISGMFRRP